VAAKRTAEWNGFEYDRVLGPYTKKRPSGPPHFQLNLYRGKVKKPKTVTRTSRGIIDALAQDLRGRLGSGKRTRKKGPYKKAPEGRTVPRAADGGEELDYNAELQALAKALRGAKTAEDVDLVKRKADALKTVRALQAALPPKEDKDPTEKMTMPQLLDAAKAHLERHGYKVIDDNAERRKAGQTEDKPGVRAGRKVKAK